MFKSLKNTLTYIFSGLFFKEIFESEAASKRESVYRVCMILCALIYFIIMLIIAQDYGVSGDEVNSHNQAVRVFNYFSDGDSAAYIDTPGYLNLYGLSANIIAEFIAKAFPPESLYNVRHYCNVIIALIGVIYIGLTGFRLFGGSGGLISLLFIILMPRYFGHSFNNLLDVPFTVGYAVSIYYIIRFFDYWPKIKIRHIVGLIVGVTFTISNRAPGIMLYGYFLFYALIFYLTYIGKKEFWKIGKFRKDIFKFSTWTIAVIVISYGLSLLVWPYGLKNPLTAVPNVLEHFSKIPVNMTTIFNGVQDLSNKLPRTYAPVYLLIGTPIFISIGIAFYLILLFLRKKNLNPAMIFILFTVLFPVIYIVYKKANLYSGMRHLTFIMPSLVLLATAGWYFLSKILSNKYKLVPFALLAVLMFLPARHMIASHPNQYVYFNEYVGGMKGGYANYDMDYFYNSIKIGSDWLKQNEDLYSDSLIIITNGSYTGYFDEYPNIHMNYCRYYETSKEDWDYAIYSNVFIRREQLINGFFPPKGTIHTINVDGYPVAAIFKRISKEDLNGFNTLKRNQTQKAKEHFKNYLKLNPNSEQVLEGYANVMLKERKLDSTIIYADSALVYNPDQLGALLLKASAQNTKKEYQAALATSEEMINVKDNFAEGHYQKGYALKNLNKPNEALKELQKAIGYKNDYYQAYHLMGEILSNYKNYKKAIEVYSKVLEKRPDDFISTVNIARNQYLSGNDEKAMEILQNIPQNYQNRLEVVAIKCRRALDKNELNEAATYLNMARNINYNSDLFVLRARFYLAQNNRQGAESLLEQAVKLDATNREANELLKSIKSTTQPAQQKTTKQESKPAQSIMYQKPKPKKTNPFTIPSK